MEFLTVRGSWREVADAARTTIGMEKGHKEPSSQWKRNLLLSEHSPIRQLVVKWKWTNLKYWVSVHFVRHKIGIEHFVSTQRTDRTGFDRDQALQSALVSHECIADAQAIINISRKRLCRQASEETRTAWTLFLDELNKVEPELHNACVPECVYRGFCPEQKSCGYVHTKAFKEMLQSYRTSEQDV
ncbi:MAG: thymidylate synthase ThyX [Lentisphaerae bacterium]|nr:thymidylate synthase ThyX [Lentisphaerota bacterium]